MTDCKLTLTIKETCALLGISEPLGYELARRPDFPSFNVGRKVLVNREKLQDWLNRESGCDNEHLS